MKILTQLMFMAVLLVCPIFANDPPPCFIDCCCACNRAGAICLWQASHCCGDGASVSASTSKLPVALQKQQRVCKLMKNEPFVAKVDDVRGNLERLQSLFSPSAVERLKQVDWSLFANSAISFTPDRLNLWKLLVELSFTNVTPIDSSAILLPPTAKQSLWQVVLYVLDPAEYLVSVSVE